MLSAQSQTLFTDGYFIATVEDEAGKIPLNKLINDTPDNPVKNILVRLLTLQEFGLDPRKAEEIADSIKYWIGGNEDSPGAGAESSYYASLDPPYEAKKAPLDCIEELLMVKGITSEIFYGTKEKPGLAMYVTADSDDGKININTAPKMVLRALAGNITPELADKMDEYRRKDSSDSDLAHPDWYKKVTGESVTMPALITVTSNYFKIISTGSMKNMTQSVSGVVKRSGSNTFQIVKWRQD
jgi:general secretion pathway protein K